MSELMINDTVPYMFGHKISYGKIVGMRIVTEIIAGQRIGVFTERSYTIQNGGYIGSDFKQENFEKAATKRLEQLRKVLRAENISYGELSELQGLAEYIGDDDVELLEPAGVPEGLTGKEWVVMSESEQNRHREENQ